MRLSTPRVRAWQAPAPVESLLGRLRQHLAYWEARHQSARNVATRRSRLLHFYEWASERGIEQPAAVTHAHVVQFQHHLFRYRKTNGQPLAVNGQRATLLTVAAFFRWLVRQRLIASNPATDLELPPCTDDLREPLNADEIAAVLEVPDITTPDGLRDRTCLEVLYATGIRRSELAALWCSDIDRFRGVLHVRRGKGQRDRFVPVGERALAWIAKYEREARLLQQKAENPRHLFLNQYGQPLSADALSGRVKAFFRQAGITKRGACHLFRHTMATAMLDNGADVRHVQEMLGHRTITSTQRYTHVSMARLSAVHAATHPAARLLRTIDGEREASSEADREA
jgi:integrase/recombinase XerD